MGFIHTQGVLAGSHPSIRPCYQALSLSNRRLYRTSLSFFEPRLSATCIGWGPPIFRSLHLLAFQRLQSLPQLVQGRIDLTLGLCELIIGVPHSFSFAHAFPKPLNSPAVFIAVLIAWVSGEAYRLKVMLGSECPMILATELTSAPSLSMLVANPCLMS